MARDNEGEISDHTDLVDRADLGEVFLEVAFASALGEASHVH